MCLNYIRKFDEFSSILLTVAVKKSTQESLICRLEVLLKFVPTASVIQELSLSETWRQNGHYIQSFSVGLSFLKGEEVNQEPVLGTMSVRILM